MKPAPFDYVAPTTVEAALQHLHQAGGEATVLAGGQTLMPLLALRMSTASVLVDINRIAALAGVARGEDGTRIGALVRQNEVVGDGAIAEALPALVEAVRHIGHHQTRNRGTVGGSISLGEPAAELPASAVALGAAIEAHSTRGVRRIPAEDFYLGPYSTALEPDELVTAIHFPDWPADSTSIFREIAQRPGDFALVGLVGALVVAEGRIARAGLAWFGMGPTPMKARQAEAALVGQTVADLDVRGMAELAIADTDPFDDSHANAEYRRTVGRRAFSRALGEALEGRQAT
ncbi:xanthine dehydrogenase family protein subunit M [Phenylobacterium sp. LjRoot225]|uniref:FAD binding domain-containing protein n=1 Tax=Phenylobacterium sp. LjRoot225 TaxID=3342285 RepID=UPI003ECFA507